MKSTAALGRFGRFLAAISEIQIFYKRCDGLLAGGPEIVLVQITITYYFYVSKLGSVKMMRIDEIVFNPRYI